MSSSSTECVASQPASRPISGSDHTCADSGLVSLMQQPSSSLSIPTLPLSAARVVEVPHTRVHHSNSNSSSNNEYSSSIGVAGTNQFSANAQRPVPRLSREENDVALACTTKQHVDLDEFEGILSLSGTTTPPSQLFSPSTPNGSCSTRRGLLSRTGTSATTLPENFKIGRIVRTSSQPDDSASASPQLIAHAPRRTSVHASNLHHTTSTAALDYPQRLRSAVQQQRGNPQSAETLDHARVPVSTTATTTTAEPAAPAAASTSYASLPLPLTSHSTELDVDVSSSNSSMEDGEEAKVGALLTKPATSSPLLVPLEVAAAAAVAVKPSARPLTSFTPPPPPSAEAAVVVPSFGCRRNTSPPAPAVVVVDPLLKDTTHISSIAQYAYNRSMASITTRPPPSASYELVKRRENGVSYINNYRIDKTLGKGTCGKVKLAFDEDQKRWVAIKIVKRADTRKRIGGLSMAQKQYNAFMREIDVMKKLRHRNIVSLYEVIDDPNADKLYLIMQYVDKGVVAKVEVRANSDFVCDPIPPAQLARYAREMLTGLQYLHRHDVVHRDLKPDNILVSKDGHAYLADFGVAETFDTSYRERMEKLMQMSMANSMAMSVAGGRASGPQVLGTKGTPLFIAPELWDGSKSYGKPVDMWAMGVTLFTLLVGKLPFRSPEDICDAHYAPIVPDAYGEKWRVLLGGLLNRDPKARWAVDKARNYVQFILDAADAPPMVLLDTAPLPVSASAPATPTTTLPGAGVPLDPLHCRAETMHATDIAAATANANTSTPGDEHILKPHTPPASPPLPPRRDDAAKHVSCSDTDSHVFDVDFLPMPEGTDETLTPEMTSAPPLTTPSIRFMPTVIAIAPSVAMAAEAASHTATYAPGDSREAGTAGGPADDANSKSTLASAFISPFDTSPAMARALSGNLKVGQSPNTFSAQLISPLSSIQSGTMFPQPPTLAQQRLPTIQLGESSGPRGRRTQHHRRGNSAASASRSATRSKSRETAGGGGGGGQQYAQQAAPAHGLQAAQPHTAHLGTTHTTSALALQQREGQRLISPRPPQLQATTMNSTDSSAATSTAPFPPASPTLSLPRSVAESAHSRHHIKMDTPPPFEAAAALASQQQQQQQQHQAPRDLARLPSPRRISSAGTQQTVTMEGIFIPSSQANGASVMDNARGLPRVLKPHEHHRSSHRTEHTDSQRIQSSTNGDISAHVVNRIN